MKFLFIDESGSYSPNIAKLDPQSPVFLVAGIILDPKTENELKKEFAKIKVKFFQRKDVVFHAREFVNPTKSKQPGFEQFIDPTFRERFYSDLTRLVARLDFKLSGFVIHVAEYLKTLGGKPPDPYILGVEVMMDTLVEVLKENEKGRIFAESRPSRQLNTAVLERWVEEIDKAGRLGLTDLKALKEHNIEKPEFINKSWSSPGLELVDLIAYHFARGLSNKAPKGPQHGIPLELINTKIIKYYALPTHPHHYLRQPKP